MPEKLKYNNKNIKNEKDKDKENEKKNEEKNEEKNENIEIDNEKLVKIFIKNCYHYTNFLDDLDDYDDLYD